MDLYPGNIAIGTKYQSILEVTQAGLKCLITLKCDNILSGSGTVTKHMWLTMNEFT